MSQFLSLSGVFDRRGADVASQVASFAETGELDFDELGDTLVHLQPNAMNCTVVYPSSFFCSDAVSRFLSAQLQTSVISLHLGEDQWMFVLFSAGQEVSWFSSIPYFGDARMPPQERQKWKGDAETVAAHVPGVLGRDIVRYFVQLDNSVSEVDALRKSYPDDEYCLGDVLQMYDFMRRIGLGRPVDAHGRVTGREIYLYRRPLVRRELTPVRPWWRFFW